MLAFKTMDTARGELRFTYSVFIHGRAMAWNRMMRELDSVLPVMNSPALPPFRVGGNELHPPRTGFASSVERDPSATYSVEKGISCDTSCSVVSLTGGGRGSAPPFEERVDMPYIGPTA